MRFVADPAVIAASVRAIRAPTLIVWGERDRLFPAGNARRLETDITGATSTIIPGCGHSPPEERPDELLQVIAPFLRAGVQSRRVA
jgi:4,5:9,10-diseco-3-hydroxy-5,9,17-trioxoandrosta-1(10),2-diene-4-oate hydrolase